MSGRPPPRSVRAGKVSLYSRAPVAAAMRPAATCPRSAQRTVAQQEHHLAPGRAAPAARRRPAPGRTWVPAAAAAARLICCGAGSCLEVHRQHQRRHATRRRHRGHDTVDRVLPEVLGPRHRAVPARHGAREGLDVRGQRRVVLEVPAGVVTDDVQDRRARAPRVVQVGQPVGEAGPEVQQGRRRTTRHATVAVCRAGADALEQAEHGAHAGHLVERTDQRHLGRAGVGETDGDASRRGGLQGDHGAGRWGLEGGVCSHGSNRTVRESC